MTSDQALARLAALCSRGEQAESDLRDKLCRWQIAPDEADGIIRRLKQENFLSDERYARAFVRDKFRFNGWGRIKIAHQLRQKGIPSEVIEEAMTSIDEEAYRQRLVELLRAKWRTVQGREPRAAWAAMMRFESSMAGECVKQVTRLDVEDD